MNFGEINKIVQADIPGLTQKKEVLRAINRTIRNINRLYPGELVTETTTSVSSGTPSDQGDYTYDDTTNKLTIIPAIKEIHKAYYNDEQLEERGFELVKEYPDEKFYHITARNNILLPANLFSNDDGDLQIQADKEISTISATADDTSIDIPQQLEQTLIDGVEYFLLAKPQYKNGDLLAQAKEEYQLGLKAAIQQEIDRLPDPDSDVEYKY